MLALLINVNEVRKATVTAATHGNVARFTFTCSPQVQLDSEDQADGFHFLCAFLIKYGVVPSALAA